MTSAVARQLIPRCPVLHNPHHSTVRSSIRSLALVTPLLAHQPQRPCTGSLRCAICTCPSLLAIAVCACADYDEFRSLMLSYRDQVIYEAKTSREEGAATAGHASPATASPAGSSGGAAVSSAAAGMSISGTAVSGSSGLTAAAPLPAAAASRDSAPSSARSTASAGAGGGSATGTGSSRAASASASGASSRGSDAGAGICSDFAGLSIVGKGVGSGGR